MTATVAAAAASRRHRVIAYLRLQGATIASAAVVLPPELTSPQAIKALVARGVVIEPRPGRFSLDEAAFSTARTSDRKVIAILMGIALVVLVVALSLFHAA